MALNSQTRNKTTTRWTLQSEKEKEIKEAWLKSLNADK